MMNFYKGPTRLSPLTDDELTARLFALCAEWDRRVAEDRAARAAGEETGRAGSPNEGLSEDIDEVETEMRRRGMEIPKVP